MNELQFRAAAAAGYDQLMVRATGELVPALLRAARLSTGQHVLDIACGTGFAAAAAVCVVGPSGHVVAADISPAMLEKARERLGSLTNVTFEIEDGQALTFRAESFDRVICNMGLMYFPDPARGLKEFLRVLCAGGHAAVTVSARPSRTLYNRVLTIIEQHAPGKRSRSGPALFNGSEQNLRALLEAAGFEDVQTVVEIRRFEFPSFDAYFTSIEHGAGHSGQEYTELPPEAQRVVREAVRRDVGDTGGPIEIELETTLARGKRAAK